TKKVKSLLFQTNNLETNLRIFIYLFIALFLLMIIVFIIKNPRIKIWNHKASLAFLFIAIFVFVFSISINQFILSKINQSFGLASKSLFVTWTGGFFFLMLVTYPIIIFLIEGKQLIRQKKTFRS
ncbi:MAG: hypothetical protein ACKO7A_00230, partial [Microcystis sp.]